jgi:hypothetical protein
MPNLAKRFASNTELFNTPIQNETATTPYGSDFVDERKYNIDASTLTGSINNYAPYYGYNVDKVAIPADIDDDDNVPRMSYDYYKHARQGFVFDMVATKAPLIQYSNYSSWDTPATPNTNNHNGGYFDNTDVGWHRQQGYLVSAANYTTGTDPDTNPGVSTMRIMVYGVPFLADVKNSDSQSIYDADTLGFNFLAPTDTYSGTPGSNHAEEIATNYLVTNTPSSPATFGGSTLLLDVTDTSAEYFRYYNGTGVDKRVTDVQFVRWGITNSLNSVPAHIDVQHGDTVTRFNTGWESFTVPAGGLDRTYTRIASVDTQLNIGKTHFDLSAVTGRTYQANTVASFEWAENGYNVYLLALESGVDGDSNHQNEWCVYRLDTETPFDWGSLTQREVVKTAQGNGNFGLSYGPIGALGGKIRLNRGYQQEVRQNGQGNAAYEAPNYNLKITVCLGGEQFDKDKIATKGHVYTLDTGSGTSTLDGCNTTPAREKRWATMWDERLCKGISRSKGGFMGAQGMIDNHSPSLVYLKHGDLPQVHEKIPQVIFGFVDVQKGYDYFLRSVKAPPPVKINQAGVQYSIGDLVLQGKDKLNDQDVEGLDKYYTEFSSENVNGTLPPYVLQTYSSSRFRDSGLTGTTAVLWSPDGTKLIWCKGGTNAATLYQVTCSTPFDLSTANWNTLIEKPIDIGPDTANQYFPIHTLKWVRSTHYPTSGSDYYDTYEHGLAIGMFGMGRQYSSSLRPAEFFKGTVNSSSNYGYDRMANYEEVVLTASGSGSNQTTPFTLEDKTVKSAYFRHNPSLYRRKRHDFGYAQIFSSTFGNTVHKWDRSFSWIKNDPVVGAPTSFNYDQSRFSYSIGFGGFDWYDQGRKGLLILNKTGPDEDDRYDPVRLSGSSPTSRRANNAGDGHGQEIWIDIDFEVPYQFFHTEANDPENTFGGDSLNTGYIWNATQAHFNYIDYEQSHFRFSYLGATMCPINFKLIDDGRKMVRMSDPGITQIVHRPWTRWVPNTLDEPSFASDNSFQAQVAKNCLFGPYSYKKNLKREVALIEKEGRSPQSYVSNPYPNTEDWGASGTAISPDGTLALVSPNDYNNFSQVLSVVDLTTNTVLRNLAEPATYTTPAQDYPWAYADGGNDSRAIAKTGGVNYGLYGKPGFDEGGSSSPTYANRGRVYLFNLDTGALLHEIQPPDDPAVSGGSVQFGGSLKMIEYVDRYGDPGLILYIAAPYDNTSYAYGSRGHFYYYDVYNNTVTLLGSHDPHDAPDPTYGGMGVDVKCLATYNYPSSYNPNRGDKNDPNILFAYQEWAFPGGRNTGYPNLGNNQGRVKLGLLELTKNSRYGPLTNNIYDGMSTFEVDTPNIAKRPRNFGFRVAIQGQLGYQMPFQTQIIISAVMTYTTYPDYDSVGGVYIFNNFNLFPNYSFTYSDPTVSPHVTFTAPSPNKPGLYRNWESGFYRFHPLLDDKIVIGSGDVARFDIYQRDGTHLETWIYSYSQRPDGFSYIGDSARLPESPALYYTDASIEDDLIPLGNRFFDLASASRQDPNTTYGEGTVFQYDLDKPTLERTVFETRVPDTIPYYFDTVYWSSAMSESFNQALLSFDTDPEGKRPIFAFGLDEADWGPYKYSYSYADEVALFQHNGKRNVRSD